MVTKLRLKLILKTTTEKKERMHNKGIAIAGVQYFTETLALGGSSVLRMKFSAINPRHRKPPKRYS